MDGYETLLTVIPTKDKSQYPFSVMDEMQVVKTRNYIELEFVKAAQAYRRANRDKKNIPIKGGADTVHGGCVIMFMDF